MQEYRIIEYTSKNKETTYAVHLVDYDQQGNPVSCSPEPILPVAASAEALSHLLIYFTSALTKPTLSYTLFMQDTDISRTTNDALNLLRKKK